MNKIFIISGPSGVGKGTIIEVLRQIPALNLVWTKSYTTRKERATDKTEQKYIFVDKEKFETLQNEGEIIEANFFNHYWYGSSKSEIEKTLKKNKNIIKDVDVNGGLYYKKVFPKSVLIFIKSDLKDIKKRLIHRDQNTEIEIQDRLQTARKELKFEYLYDYTVINTQNYPEQSINEIKNIILKEIA